jgi:hypothetical protein
LGFGGQLQWPFQGDQNNFFKFLEFLAEKEKQLQALSQLPRTSMHDTSDTLVKLQVNFQCDLSIFIITVSKT